MSDRTSLTGLCFFFNRVFALSVVHKRADLLSATLGDG